LILHNPRSTATPRGDRACAKARAHRLRGFEVAAYSPNISSGGLDVNCITSFVNFPIEIRSTPVFAIARTVSRFTLPDLPDTLELRPPRVDLHPSPHVVEAEVVDHDLRRPRGQRLFQLAQILELDRSPGAAV
jgi:hypothetical protein